MYLAYRLGVRGVTTKTVLLNMQILDILPVSAFVIKRRF